MGRAIRATGPVTGTVHMGAHLAHQATILTAPITSPKKILRHVPSCEINFPYPFKVGVFVIAIFFFM